MFTRALAVLAGVATVVAGVFAVIAYFFPPTPKTDNALINDSKPASNSGSNVRTGTQIKQESRGNNSPNIIGDRNVINR
jgi:hypothetical protein